MIFVLWSFPLKDELEEGKVHDLKGQKRPIFLYGRFLSIIKKLFGGTYEGFQVFIFPLRNLVIKP